MIKIKILGVLVILLFACNPATVTLPDATATIPQATAIKPQTTPTNLNIPQEVEATKTIEPPPTKHISALVTQTQAPLSFSEPGLKQTGRRNYKFIDPYRENRIVEISVWYPAIFQEGQTENVVQEALPDLNEAPYPVILSSAKGGGFYAPHLVSYGFVVVGIRNIDYYEPWDQNLIDQPLDFLFALDLISTNPFEGLEGVIDNERAGVMGYSFDGYNSLALSGARIDPNFYLEQCEKIPFEEPSLSEWRIWYYCDLATKWDIFETYAGSHNIARDDDLWQPMTDERILAVIPMAPEGARLFGDMGLAETDRPILILVGTRDVAAPYESEAVYIYEYLGSANKALISFIGQDHYMIYKDEQLARMKHFAVAFFGHYLQGREEYAEYFSEKFVEQYDDLAWGVYKE